MAYPPAVSDFKALFARDFVFGPATSNVMDADIQNAINQTQIVFNPCLWDGTTALGTTTEQNIAFLWLSAHFMSLAIQGAGGLSAINKGRGVLSQGGGATQSKGVGGVNVAYAISDDIKNSPILGQFMQTGYGQGYLQMLAPRLIANVAVVAGGGALMGFGLLGLTYPTPLQITTSTLPGGTHAVAYSQTVKALGGAGAYAWTITAGNLPTSLTLGATTGVIAGTPSIAGTYYFTVMVADVLGSTNKMNYQVVIA